jgi:hypothetical protein
MTTYWGILNVFLTDYVIGGCNSKFLRVSFLRGETPEAVSET